MKQLIFTFHALEGETLQNKRKSFNRLLNQIQQELTTDDDLNTFIVALTPKNKLEEILRVEILLRFQRNRALFDVLKSGNVVLIRKVLNCWRFFEVAFVEIEANTLVDDVFPHTSFSTRMKVIARLAANLKDEIQADSYFGAIEKKYGLKVATAILPACSLNLIKLTVKTYKVKLCARQLLKIFRKHPEFLNFYFDIHYKDLTSEYNKVIKHVARVDKELFWNLCDKYEFNVKFGRHMTSYLYTPEYVRKYKVENFSVKKIYADVKNDERKMCDFVKALFPKNADDFYFEFANRYKTLQKIIKYTPKYKRYAIINKGFREMYGKDLCEFYEDGMSEEVLEIIPVEKRKEIVDKKNFKDESFIYMWPPYLSIPALKERIKYNTDQNERCELAVQLFKTCRVNDDLEAFVEVLGYIRNQFKNDTYILTVFIIQFFDGWPRQDKLEDAHWTHITNILKPLADDSRIYWHSMEGYFRYKMKLNLGHDDFIKLFIKTMAEARSVFFWMFLGPEFDKKCFEHMAGLIPKIFHGKEYRDAAIWLLRGMVCHNKKSSSGKILLSNYPDFVQVVKSSLKNENCSEEVTIMKYCVRFEHAEDKEYDRLFWKHYDQMHDGDILLWYLRNKPLAVFQNIDQVLQDASPHIPFKQLSSTFRIIAMYAPCGTTEKIVAHALDLLKANHPYKSEFALVALSHLTNEQTYFDATKPFYPPEDGKIIYENLDKNRLRVQELVAKNLVTLQEPHAGLHSLVKFCKGDYLKYAYGSLFKVTSCTPEVHLDQFFDVLFNSAVSVRKHVVSLVTSLSSKSTVCNFLKRIGEFEKHATLRKTVFKNTLRYFLAQQSEDFWNLFQCNIKIIDKDDAEAYEYLVNLRKIPSKYLPQYIQLVYEVLAKQESQQIQNKKWDLLNGISDDLFQDLSKEFLQNIITETLFTQNCSDFWAKCIFNTAGQKPEEMLLFTFDLFKNYYSSKLSKEVLQNVHVFVSDFCMRALVSNANEKLMEKFIELWSKTVVKNVFYEEELQLQLTQDYLTCHSANKLCEFGSKAKGLLVYWVKKYDVTYMFAENLKSLLDSVIIFEENEEKLAAFLENFCCVNEDGYSYIVAMKLLSEQANSPHFDEVVVKIRDCKLPSVRIRFGTFLKMLSSAV